ncbi:SDR family oxidoreductase [Asticcacaulis sp. BYS171W]|uniref:SDR family oxidoreductase n=1 Tax=Asticcacaulis aquaticus TaxID=2984212 RepID=A0ABT5HUI4_9CAUL|nr:SDR family oxidoreductase [Asticcacaulis aquaticus]MDC7683730.1 SDR family oxidoreductase [Asticcacaulis aquaticus]
MAILLTGATGSVGLELLRLWDDRHDGPLVYCLVRAPDRTAGLARWTAYCRAQGLKGRRFVPIIGDIEHPGLGLSATDRQALQAEITTIIHAAAHIRFDAPYPVAHATNVAGTQSILDFAKGCADLKRFCQVSTLFVVGQRSGVVPPGGGPEGAAFNNSYEETKYEAEALVLASGLPVEIVRLSLMPGRQSDGYIHHYLEAHMLFEAFGRGFCGSFPGTGASPLDMLPVDYSATCLALHLDKPGFDIGAIHAVAAGAQATTMQDIYDSIASTRSARGLSVPPLPEWLPEAKFNAMLETETPEDFGISFGAQMIFRSVGAYIAKPKHFEGSMNILYTPPPAPISWLPAVIGYALDDNWGRGRTRAAS